MPVPRLYASSADRQRAHRQRRDVLLEDLELLLFELQEACARGRTPGLASHLPESPMDWVPELTMRLRSSRLVRHNLETEDELKAKRDRRNARRRAQRQKVKDASGKSTGKRAKREREFSQRVEQLMHGLEPRGGETPQAGG